MLWLFGPAIEDRLGHGAHLAFYLACGVAAAIAHVVFNPTSTVPALGAFHCSSKCPRSCSSASGSCCRYCKGPRSSSRRRPEEASRGGRTSGALWRDLRSAPVLRGSARTYRAYYPDEGILGFNTWGRP